MMAETFREFEAYSTAIEDADLRLMLPKLGHPRWELCSFYIGELHLQYGSEWNGVIAEGATRPDGQVLFVPLHGNHLANGVSLERNSVFLIDSSSEFTISVSQQHAWCSIFLPWSLLQDAWQDFPSQNGALDRHRVIRLPSQEVAETRSLLIHLQRVVDAQPKALSSGLLSSLVQRQMVSLWRRLLSFECQPVVQAGRPMLVRSEVIRTVRRVIEEPPGECVTIEDLVAATQVSERTLRTIFLEFYGMPPQRFLMMRRLNQAYATLRSADPDETSVTAIAAHYGFWHFGRFAGAYHKMFGEPPSTTLHSRQPLCGSHCMTAT